MEIILQDLDPKEAYLKWFSDNNQIRPNGRGLFDLPNVSFKSGTISSAEGSGMINYGETIVVAAVKTEVAEPSVSSPNKGFLVVNFHFAAGARADIKPGPPSEELQEITERLSKLINVHVFDLNSLCIASNILSRVLYIDVACLCDTGFAFEASLLACLYALKNAALCVPNLDNQSGLVCFDKEIRECVELLTWPCSFTFAIINNAIILEPDADELRACGKSRIQIISDLFSNSIIEIIKGTVMIEDDKIMSQIQPILKNSCEKIRALLDFK